MRVVKGYLWLSCSNEDEGVLWVHDFGWKCTKRQNDNGVKADGGDEWRTLLPERREKYQERDMDTINRPS